MPIRVFAAITSPALRQAVAGLPDAEPHLFPDPDAPDRTEAEAGDRAMVARVADLHPALIVAELDQPLPWLSAVRSDPATRRIPAVGIGTGEAAAERSAGLRMPYYPAATFLADTAAILADHARSDAAAVADLAGMCDSPLPPLVLRGLHEFNAGEYYECHETLETAWMAEPGPVRNLYRVVLQVAVAYYQIVRGNYNGAQKMFLRAVQWFAPLPDRCQGIDVAALRADVATVRAHLEALGPARIAEFDRSLLRPVQFEA